jgi:hypothetical protein
VAGQEDICKNLRVRPTGSATAKNGYEKVNSLDGARIRCIKHPEGGYYMPYIDGAAGAYKQGKWLVLGRADEDNEDDCRDDCRDDPDYLPTDLTNGSTDEDVSADVEYDPCDGCGKHRRLHSEWVLFRLL